MGPRRVVVKSWETDHGDLPSSWNSLKFYIWACVSCVLYNFSLTSHNFSINNAIFNFFDRMPFLTALGVDLMSRI